MLMIGGGLCVLGLIIWLTSVGLFENKLVLAAALGLGSLAVLGAGWYLVLRTKYMVAGQALTNLEAIEGERRSQLATLERLTALYDLGRTFTSTLKEEKRHSPRNAGPRFFLRLQPRLSETIAIEQAQKVDAVQLSGVGGSGDVALVLRQH